jgi:hypothetical protein
LYKKRKNSFAVLISHTKKVNFHSDVVHSIPFYRNRQRMRKLAYNKQISHTFLGKPMGQTWIPKIQLYSAHD